MYKASCNIVFFVGKPFGSPDTKKISNVIACTAQANQHDIRIALFERDYLFNCHPTMNITNLWGKRR